MTDVEVEEEEPPKKGKKLHIVIGLVLALAGGGGGFFAVYSGMILGQPDDAAHVEDPPTIDPLPDLAFVPVDQLVIPVGPPSKRENLIFRAQLEVASAYQTDVELLLPRVVDVMNSYLRALQLTDLDDPAVLIRLRSQLLRRIQLVTGDGRVNDLLIMEFVLN